MENEVRPEDGSRAPRVEPYGGRRLLEGMARLFGWQGLIFEAPARASSG